MISPVDDAELIEGCKQGRRDAQRAMFDRYHERIYRLLLRLTRDEHQAFDLAQDTFLRAFDRIRDFEGRSGLGTWLYRIATNEGLQWLRRRRTERRHLEIIAQQRNTPERDPDVPDTPDIDQALATLSEQHRLILLLRYQENLDYAQLAEVLDCSPGTVASRLNRARAELRAALTRQNHDDEEETTHPTHPHKQE